MEGKWFLESEGRRVSIHPPLRERIPLHSFSELLGIEATTHGVTSSSTGG